LSFEEFRNLVLMEFQRNGIDPFYVRKTGEIPAEGDNYSKFLADRLVGNIVDGIPGYEIKTDGTLHNKARGPVQDHTWQQLAYSLMVGGYPTYINSAGLHEKEYDVDISASIVLGGGVVNNATLISCPAGVKIGLLRIAWDWDIDPAAAYVITYHQTGGAGIMTQTFAPTDRGKWFDVLLDTTTAAQDLECDVTGGAGVEVLSPKIMYCTFT